MDIDGLREERRTDGMDDRMDGHGWIDMDGWIRTDTDGGMEPVGLGGQGRTDRTGRTD